MPIVRYIKHLLAPSHAQLPHASITGDVTTVPVLERVLFRVSRHPFGRRLDAVVEMA